MNTKLAETNDEFDKKLNMLKLEEEKRILAQQNSIDSIQKDVIQQTRMLKKMAERDFVSFSDINALEEKIRQVVVEAEEKSRENKFRNERLLFLLEKKMTHYLERKLQSLNLQMQEIQQNAMRSMNKSPLKVKISNSNSQNGSPTHKKFDQDRQLQILESFDDGDFQLPDGTIFKSPVNRKKEAQKIILNKIKKSLNHQYKSNYEKIIPLRT